MNTSNRELNANRNIFDPIWVNGAMANLCTMLVLVILRATMMVVLVVLSYFVCNSSGDGGGDLVKRVVSV